MNKLKNIEFLRVFLIIAIVFLHMFIDRKWNLCTLYPDIPLYKTIESAIAHSNNAVEGFFIVAGFFLVYTYNPTTKIKDFVIKKYTRLSPVILFSIILCIFGWLLGTMDFELVPNILTVLLLNSFVIKITVGNNPILWYTSVLFAGLLLYFCVIKYIPSKVSNWIIGILSITAFVVLEILQHGSFANPLKNYYHIFNIGFLRAAGGIGLGCLIGIMYKNSEFFNKLPSTKNWHIIYSLFEISLMGTLICWCMCIHSRINNIIFVICFACLFILFLSNKGFLSKVTDKSIWVKLGKYQYSIYVVHYVIIRILGLSVWKNYPEFINSHPIIPIVFDLTAILFVGVLTYYMVELPCAKFLKDKLLRKEN